MRTISSFTDGLRCMDTLLQRHGKQGILITSNGVPDATGRVAGGTREMLISAVSRMSARSQAFRFVDFEPNLDDVNALYSLIGVQPEFRVPSYYIRGAITQLDDNVISEAGSAGISLPGFDLGVSRDQVVSVISVDLNMGELITRQIIPGMSASNSIAVVSRGAGADAGGVISKAGLAFNVSLSQSEGFHQAVRTLIELSTIEVLGKLTRTPYWQCLGIDQTNPTFMSQAREWFDTMGERERVRFAQRVLQADRYYDGPVTGVPDDRTRDAIGRYQVDNDLIASGRVDFDLYHSLLGRQTIHAMQPEAPGIPANPVAAAASDTARPAAATGGGAAELSLTTERGTAPLYRPGEAVVVRAHTTDAAFLYCYYVDAGGGVARIFPNRFQPDALVPAAATVEIPPGPATMKPFNIRMDRPGARETIACVASPTELGVGLPDRFKTEDLETISGVSLDQLLDAFAGTSDAGLLRVRQLPITVADG
ncbi:MAG TPA: DUF4384 domain-containing protein [Arenibaculum sp.]|nr:DUF4384 domain-containing protein [Arenibaculum sp.]